MPEPRLFQPRKPLSDALIASRFSAIGRGFSGLILSILFLALLAGCTVHEDRGASGEKKVDISTPFGNLKVNTDVDVKDTGLPVYPGAERVQSSDNDKDKNAANVTISVGGVGLKVVAIKYHSDDSPDKVLAFYRPKMKDFGGKFLECTQQSFGSYSYSSDKKGEDKELTCDKVHNGTDIELKAGTPDRQHIVAVKPKGSGSDFALVYVMKRGKEGM